MKLLFNVATLLVVTSFITIAEEVALKPLDTLPLDEDELAYVVEDGEADVSDDLIKRITIGRKEVTATYRNKGEEAKRPRYTIKLYNHYGLLLGEDTVGNTISIFGGIGSVDPGDVATEDLSVDWVPLNRVMKKSALTVPEDWRDVKWVVISETNTRPSPKKEIGQNNDDTAVDAQKTGANQ